MLLCIFSVRSFGKISRNRVVKVKDYFNFDSYWEGKTPPNGIFEFLFPQTLAESKNY